jgi:hypothetical protein
MTFSIISGVKKAVGASATGLSYREGQKSPVANFLQTMSDAVYHLHSSKYVQIRSKAKNNNPQERTWIEHVTLGYVAVI